MTVVRFQPLAQVPKGGPSARPVVPASDVRPLAAAEAGQRVRIVEVLGGKHLLRRLADLGLRVGSEVELLNRRGCGVVLRRRGQAVALGGGVARKVLVAAVEP